LLHHEIGEELSLVHQHAVALMEPRQQQQQEKEDRRKKRMVVLSGHKIEWHSRRWTMIEQHDIDKVKWKDTICCLLVSSLLTSRKSSAGSTVSGSTRKSASRSSPARDATLVGRLIMMVDGCG
jgi:hypothetical protein